MGHPRVSRPASVCEPTLATKNNDAVRVEHLVSRRILFEMERRVGVG